MAADPSYPLYPIACFICFILVLIPLPWHLQAWNTGTCMYMIWTAVALLNQFVNSIVWSDNAINVAPVWCDISARIIVGTSVAIPAASLVISIRLWKIARVQAVTESPRQRRNGLILDLGLTIGLPVLVMALQYVVQGHRFNIYEQIGCWPATFNTPPAYPLVFMWPLLLGVISFVFCVLTLASFLKRRKEMNQFLSSNAQVTFSRYFRLMALACMDTLLTIPFASFAIWINTTQYGGPAPWRGWADAKWGFSRVGTFPAIFWQSDKYGKMSFAMSRAFIVVCAVVFFAFFGFAEEARKNYRRVFWGVARKFGYSMPTRGTTMGTSNLRTPNIGGMSALNTTGSRNNAPRVYITTETKTEKRDSFISSVGDLSSSFSVDNRHSIDEKYDSKRNEKLSPSSTTMSGSSSGSFMDMTATSNSKRSFESMRDVESGPQTPAEEVELRGLPRLTSDAPPKGPSAV